MEDATRKFTAVDSKAEMKEILSSVYNSLMVKGYNPINQIVGYILSEDPTYITNYNNARSLICRIDRDELMQELRNQGCLDISRVEYAVLETDGRLNVMLYPLEQPVTAGQMNVRCRDGGYPVIVISDGRVNEENLSRAGIDRKWLDRELKKRGVGSAEKVFLMTVNTQKEIYLAESEAAK